KARTTAARPMRPLRGTVRLWALAFQLLTFNFNGEKIANSAFGGDLIQIKRAYEPSDRKDGFRVLIDRLWPRGIKKEKLPLDAWMKELAPSNELRKEFGHNPDLW